MSFRTDMHVEEKSRPGRQLLRDQITKAGIDGVSHVWDRDRAGIARRW